MDYTYGEYDVRLVLNAADAIVRFEERATRKLFEATFFDRDFAEFKSIGGLEFVMKVLMTALRNYLKGVSTGVTMALTFVEKNLLLTLTYTPELIPKPIVIDISLPAIRRASCDEDTETLTCRVKELEAKLAEMSELQKKYVADVETPALRRMKERESKIGEIPKLVENAIAEFNRRVVELEKKEREQYKVTQEFRENNRRLWQKLAPSGDLVMPGTLGGRLCLGKDLIYAV